MEENLEEHLKQFRLGSLPTVFYIPNFVSKSEETHLLQYIYGVPASKWKSLKNRRLQNWVFQKAAHLEPRWARGCLAHSSGLGGPSGHLPRGELPLVEEVWFMRRVSSLKTPHQDGPAYFPIVAILSLGSPAVMNFTPHLKLTECVTHVPDQIDKHCTLSVALIPCSLLIFKDSAYSEYLHGIDDSDIQRIDEVVNIGDILSYKEQMMPLSSELEEGDQRTEKGSIHRSGTRVSLTCRLVPKVHKNLLKF
ncbi:alpha-ketoglutarate-dependent dioxygenase alkB homolog 6 isoform X3 [Amborella trichopoda]|uniref:alpha-ketoglutarate-dependent dioxygenase alkB homolog 6 isoform X3 n=1 Tax=Amborella trichopoda TaxID=13333 RepID=UPI0009BD8F2F|nr:alpha-ketoglutarate-dependent dioxygenase alkB homolog 6 isoform X3 [Amborella trichopoda]|eukprot:XP_020517584.1 alpha-ketoglutarate-dependent dioxygenase alkB homolog 6 isoform X3 [Amborella trichopoda]